MNHVGDKVISIAQSSDKRQVTAVITATLTGELLAPQILYQGKTVHCHPKVPIFLIIGISGTVKIISQINTL